MSTWGIIADGGDGRPRAPLASRVALAAVLLASVASAPTAAADNASNTAAALKVITQTADEICTTVPVEGSHNTLSLSGQANAALNTAIARLVQINIKGAARFETEHYKGVLQTNLAGILKENINCKKDVFDKLEKTLITQPSAINIAPGAGQTVINGTHICGYATAVSAGGQHNYMANLDIQKNCVPPRPYHPTGQFSHLSDAEFVQKVIDTTTNMLAATDAEDDQVEQLWEQERAEMEKANLFEKQEKIFHRYGDLTEHLTRSESNDLKAKYQATVREFYAELVIRLRRMRIPVPEPEWNVVNVFLAEGNMGARDTAGYLRQLSDLICHTATACATVNGAHR